MCDKSDGMNADDDNKGKDHVDTKTMTYILFAAFEKLEPREQNEIADRLAREPEIERIRSEQTVIDMKAGVDPDSIDVTTE